MEPEATVPLSVYEAMKIDLEKQLIQKCRDYDRVYAEKNGARQAFESAIETLAIQLK